MVDTGIATNKTMKLWENIFTSTIGPSGKPITGLIITHFHPDHFGLAGWIARKWNMTIQMSATEWGIGQHLSRLNDLNDLNVAHKNSLSDDGEMSETGDAQGLTKDTSIELDVSNSIIADYEKKCGIVSGGPESQANASIHDHNNYHKFNSNLPNDYHRLQEHDLIQIGNRKWKVIIGEGHSPEHVCLFSEQDSLLIAGDQILARISPNVSVWPSDPTANPLKQFLSSMTKLRRLPASTLVLGSHDAPFFGLHSRLKQIEHHHQERLDLLLTLCKSPQTVMTILPLLFKRDLTPDQLPFAIGEALAHLNYLVVDKQMTRTLNSGTWYFTSRQEL
jgi:glyoxylase-like metal-dependent hydrolase (beta-lactamase superfamily II)